MQDSLLTQLRVLRVKQTRLEKDPPAQDEIDSAEDALCNWQEYRDKINALDADILARRARPQDCLQLVNEGNDAITPLAGVLDDSPEALNLVLTRDELDRVEREYYHVLMTPKKQG
jgi:hypothetical protein